MTDTIDQLEARFRRGDAAGALQALEQHLVRHPRDVRALLFAGEISARLRGPDAAVRFFEAAVREEAQSAIAQRKLAEALLDASRHAEAVIVYRRAIALEPGVARAHNNLGRALELAGNPDLARACYLRALALDPRYPPALHNLGNLAAQAAEHGAALEWFRQVIALRPGMHQARLGCARSLLALGRAGESLVETEAVLRHSPADPAAQKLHARALLRLGRTDEASAALDAALVHSPQDDDALCLRADLKRQRGDWRGAVRDFELALAANPGSGMARIGAVIARIPALAETAEETASSRLEFRRALEALVADIEARPVADASTLVGAVQPFFLSYQEQDNRPLLEIHGRMCCALMAGWRGSRRRATALAPRPRPTPIRIGIVSAQLFSHSVYDAITRGWLAVLDRQRFRLALFSLGTLRDAATAQAQAQADLFVDGPRSLESWVEAIEAEAPDVLLYPEVGMDALTLQLASQRLAPVQVAAWGHPETTGLPTIDYFLSAELFEPPAAAAAYSEHLVRLPNLGCHYALLQMPPATPGPHTRNASEIRLVCPGTPFKYAPEHDQVLVRIAQADTRSRFIFFKFQDGHLSERLHARLAGAFRAAGLDPGVHLQWRDWAEPAEFDALLRAADLMLDTLGFSGFNTVLKALEAGLPVISCRGRFLRGRLGAGLLDRIGLGDALAVSAPDEYVPRTLALMADPAARTQLRLEIESRRACIYADPSFADAFPDFLVRVSMPP